MSGWNSALAPLATRELGSLPPLVICNVSMHSFLLTEAALPLLAADQPELVRHRDDPAWVEQHLPGILEGFSRIAGLTAGKLATFMEGLEAAGIGSADDLSLTGEAAFQELRRSSWAGRVHCWATPATFRALGPAAREAMAGFKFFTDGALGARTARLSGSFRNGGRGLLLYRFEELLAALGECHGEGKPVAIHAIGDEAIAQALDVLWQLERDAVRFPAVRLEHAQFIDETQARRAMALGVTLSMQPNFNSESLTYADRLEARWLERNNPFRMLIDRVGFTPGKDLRFSSDGMPHGAEYAVQWSLFPPWAGQRLTLAELVAGYGGGGANGPGSLMEIDWDRRIVRRVPRQA